MVAPLATINGTTLTGIPSLVSLILTNTAGSFVFPGLPDGSPDSLFAKTAVWNTVGAVPYVSANVTTQNTVAHFLLAGTVIFSASQYANPSMTLGAVVRGVEVSRVVPEPSSSALLLSVALPFAAYLHWRHRRTRKARESRA